MLRLDRSRTFLIVMLATHAALTGSIPENLGNLGQLGRLDLRKNDLTGECIVFLVCCEFVQTMLFPFGSILPDATSGILWYNCKTINDCANSFPADC